MISQVNRLNPLYFPFTCLDEDIKNMEVCSGLSKCLEQILLKIKSNMEPRHPSALPVLPNMSFGRLHVLLIVVVDIVVSELPQTTVVTNERQVNGLNHLYPPFTCLDENMLHRHFRAVHYCCSAVMSCHLSDVLCFKANNKKQSHYDWVVWRFFTEPAYCGTLFSIWCLVLALYFATFFC